MYLTTNDNVIRSRGEVLFDCYLFKLKDARTTLLEFRGDW